MPKKTAYLFKKLAAIEQIKTPKGLRKLGKAIFGSRYKDELSECEDDEPKDESDSDRAKDTDSA